MTTCPRCGVDETAYEEMMHARHNCQGAETEILSTALRLGTLVQTYPRYKCLKCQCLDIHRPACLALDQAETCCHYEPKERTR